jgi:hypothetical protein
MNNVINGRNPKDLNQSDRHRGWIQHGWLKRIRE